MSGKPTNIAQKLYLEPTIGKAAYRALEQAIDDVQWELNKLTSGGGEEVREAMTALRAAVAGWTPVSAPAFPSYIGGRRDLIDVLDSSIGLVGGFLRALPSRDEDRTRTDKAHRTFERFAARIGELYREDLDDLEEEYQREADERAEDALEAMLDEGARLGVLEGDDDDDDGIDGEDGPDEDGLEARE